MTRYLLGTQALVDLARGDAPNEVRMWMARDEVRTRAVFVSVMSFEIFRCEVDRQEGVQREVWIELFDEARRKLESSGLIVPVTLEIAVRSARLRRLELQASDPEATKPSDLDPRERLVAATALVENLTLVDRRQPYHDELEDLGLSLFDPYSQEAP